MDTEITLHIKELIKNTTGVDINKVSRKRETVEARAMYYKILKQIDKKKTLQSIADSVGKNHATVLHSLNNYDTFEQFNPTLKLFRKEILSRLNYKSFENIVDSSKDEKITALQIEVIKQSEEILELKENINKLKETRYKYNIVTNIEQLLLDTEGSEQQQIILERLQALYRMNRNIKL
jgi:hypothetical protein